MNKQILTNIIIRAAGLQRLISNINDFKLPDLSDLLKDDEIIQYSISNHPRAYFPSNEIGDIISTLNKILKCYLINGEIIHEKITMIFSMSVTLNNNLQNEKNQSAQKREAEVWDLSKKFYDLSKKIQGKKIKCVCQKMDIKTQKYHPESEFVKFSVSYSP